MSYQGSDTNPAFEDGIIDHSTMNHAAQRESIQQQSMDRNNNLQLRSDTNNPPTALQYAGGRSELDQECPVTPPD